MTQSSLRGVSRHALVYGVGTLAAKAVSFVMLPVYTRFLSPSDYGVLELIGMTLDIAAILAGTQIAQGVFRYYHKATDDEARRGVVATALLTVTLSYVLVAAVTYVTAEPLSHLVFKTTAQAPLIRLASLTMAVSPLTFVPLTFCRLTDLSGVFVATNLAKLALQLALNVLFVVELRVGVVGVFWSNLIASVVISVILGVWLVRRTGWRPNVDATRDLLRYGGPLIATQAATFIVAFGDRYFLEASHGTAEVGRYSVVYQFGFLLQAIGYSPFQSVWDSRRFAIAHQPDRDAVYSRAFLYMNLVLIGLCVAMGLFAPVVLRVMTTEGFHLPAAVIVLILVGYVLQGWSVHQDVGILLAERTRYVAIANWAAALVAVAAYALLIPPLASLGAAIGTVLAFSARYALTYWFAQRCTPIAWRWGPLLRLVVLGGLALVAAALLPEDVPFVEEVATRLLVFVVFAAAVLAAGVLDARERARGLEVARDILARVRAVGQRRGVGSKS